jgi:glycosyltransferase involved in cell wall biosynthesis
MKLALDLVCTSKNSGTKSYNSNFCKSLSECLLEDNVTIYICNSLYNEIKKDLRVNKKINYEIKSNILSITIFRLIWMQFILPISLKKKNIDILYSPMNFVPLIIKRLNIKSVLCLHTNLPWVHFEKMPGNILRNILTKKLIEFSINKCDKLIVNSDYAKSEITNLLNLKDKSIERVYLGVSDEFLKKNIRKKRMKNFNYNQNYIFSVMSCVKYHNILNILKAFNNLNKGRNFNYKLVIIMQILDRKYYNTLKNYIYQEGLEHSVQIFDNIGSEYLPDLYKFASLYLFTSYSEVFGLTTLEAMTQGCNVIVSNTSSLPEINSNAADYFDPDDIKNIEDIILKNIKDETHKNEILKNAKLRYQLFSWKLNASETLKIIKKIDN